MQFKFVAAVLAALFVITTAQDEKKEDGYEVNPKFKYADVPKPTEPTPPATPEIPEHKVPELPKVEVPEVPKYEKPELPKYEKPEVPKYDQPEFPKYEQPEFPKYEQPDLPKYEEPEFPEYEKPSITVYEHPSVPEYHEDEAEEYEKPEYPSNHGYPEYINHYPAGHFYYGHPDFTAEQPKEMEKMDEEKTEGDYTPHESKMKEEEKKDDSNMEEEKKENMKEEEKKEDFYGFPVFNFHEYELPKIEEHNFDDFKYNLSDPVEDENSTASDYFKIQAAHEVPVAKNYQQVNHYYPNQYPAVPGAYAPHNPKVDYHPVPSPATYPQQHAPEYPHQGKPNYNVPQPEYPPHHQQQGKPEYNVPFPGEYQNKYPSYQPNAGAHEYTNTVEGEASYYRLDTCEYRFILDMVQCHQVERHSEKVNVHSNGQGHHYQGQGPQYYNNYNVPAGPYGNNYNNAYPFQAPYDSRYYDFMRLYGNPMYYVDHANGHSYKPGHFDDSLFSFSPSVGHPFYAPGLHNTPFANYYAGFKAGKFEQGHEAETRQYHREGHYQAAVQDFHNLKLQNVVKLDTEAQSSVKTASHVSVSNEAGYEGVTPSFNYRVKLLPNHCSVPGYDGKHTCIVFSGEFPVKDRATHPYRMVHRQFVYLKNSREVQGKYRFRYENGQRVQY